MKPLLIGGAWVETSHALPNINPSDTGDVIDHYAQAGRAEAQSAIRAAAEAFGDWALSNPQERHDLLAAVGADLIARADEIGTLLSREEGKIRSEGVTEVTRAGRIFQFFAGEALRPGGEVLPSVRPGIEVQVTREPVGPVGLIAPWNFPAAIPAWKLAPALAWGNTVVLKPAELVPGTAWAIVDSLHRHGCPPGVVNLVMGEGRVVGQEMLDAPALAAISFTGSQATGRRVAEASLAHGRRVQLEMGGKNPLVVLDDADLDLACDVALDGAFFSTGQRCTASSRLIVTEGIHGRFVERLTEKVRALKVGPALDPASQIGPVVDAAQLETVLGHIDRARRDGAVLRCGGARVSGPTPGFYLAPALFTDTDPAMAINREEVFGPVATVIRARDYDHSLALANETEFGLSAGICTTSLAHSAHFRRHAEAGMVFVNLPTAGVDFHVPFGGRKGSSMGPREQGTYARDFYSQIKTSYIRAG